MNRRSKIDSDNFPEQFERVVKFEKKIEPNPFLDEVIFSKIEALENREERYSHSLKERFLSPVMISLSVAAILFFGIVLITTDKIELISNSSPEEFALLDDSSIESANIFIND